MEIIMERSKPKINVQYTNKATIIAFTDEKILEEKDINELQQSILSVVDQGQRINLVLDFSNVRFLSSAVLGLLIRVSKKVYEREGQLKLCCISAKLREIFKITRLNRIFDIYKDLESATESLLTPE